MLFFMNIAHSLLSLQNDPPSNQVIFYRNTMLEVESTLGVINAMGFLTDLHVQKSATLLYMSISCIEGQDYFCRLFSGADNVERAHQYRKVKLDKWGLGLLCKHCLGPYDIWSSLQQSSIFTLLGLTPLQVLMNKFMKY